MTTDRCPVAPADPDRLGRNEYAAWIAHLESCAACAEAWDTADPSRMFRALCGEPLPEAVLEAVSDTVLRVIAADLQADRARRRRAWLATAAAALLGAAFGSTAFHGPAREPASVARTAEIDAIRAHDDHADVRVTTTSDEVRIVDLTVGGNQVVMIFDERMQL